MPFYAQWISMEIFSGDVLIRPTAFLTDGYSNVVTGKPTQQLNKHTRNLRRGCSGWKTAERS